MTERFSPIPTYWLTPSRTRYVMLCALMTMLSCKNVELVFKNPNVDNRVVVSLAQSSLVVAKAGEQPITATVTRSGDVSGDVPLTVTGLPAGITATFSNWVTSGKTTTSTLTFRVSTIVAPALYQVVVHAQVDGVPEIAAALTLNIIEAPSVSISAAKAALTIARGGSSETGAVITRINVSGAVTVSLGSTSGISAVFVSMPASPDTGILRISVASSVAPGTYALVLHASAAGATSGDVPFSVTVSGDALQLIPIGSLNVAQADSARTDIIVNHVDATFVVLSAENLPNGVSVSFPPASTTSNRSTIVVSAAPTTIPGDYSIILRGKANGVPDATAPLGLTISQASIAVAALPAALSLAPGSSGTVALSLSRSAYGGNVSFTAESVPVGASVTFAPQSTSGSTAVATIAVSSATPAGMFGLTIRATPAGFPASASRTASIALSVRTTTAGSGNVTLDWSRCQAPEWIAGQDGNGIWTQVIPEQGVARFNATSDVGGFAYASASSGLTVRYLTWAELTAQAIDLCDPAPTKRVTGTGFQTNTAAATTYSLGGATISSPGTAPAFTLTGVRDGPQDLVAYYFGSRMLLRRDQDIPDGGSLGLVDAATGAESFAVDHTTVNVQGPILAADALSNSMSLLTRVTCTENFLYSSANGTANAGGNLNFTLSVSTVPATYRVATDFHQFTYFVASATGSRSTALTFRSGPATISVPPVFGAPTVSSLAGSYARLQASIASIPGSYNTSVSLTYGVARPMSVTASIGYATATGVTLAMPDLSGVSGWKSAYALAAGSTGSWTVTVKGSTVPGSACVEGKAIFTARQSGSF